MSRHYSKLIYSFLVRLINSFMSLISVMFFSSISSNRQIKDLLTDDSECYVLGNGPSLNDILVNNIDLIQGRVLFAVNFFCNTDYFEALKPQYYVVIDPSFFTVGAENNEQQNFDRFTKRLNGVSWKMAVFVPHQFKRSPVLRDLNNPNLNLVFINTTPVKGLERVNYFLYNRGLGMPMPQTVINAAIFIAIRMRFKKVHLLGTDQSWLRGMFVDEHNIVRSELTHFYPAKIDIRPPSLSNLLITQYNVFYGHEQLQKYSVYCESEILNHVRDSYIDAYRKI